METGLRRSVRDRAGNRCEYCGLRQEHAPLALYTIDHIIPKKHGGSDDSLNLAFACYHCNIHKGPNLAGIDPVPGRARMEGVPPSQGTPGPPLHRDAPCGLEARTPRARRRTAPGSSPGQPLARSRQGLSTPQLRLSAR